MKGRGGPEQEANSQGVLSARQNLGFTGASHLEQSYLVKKKQIFIYAE